MADNDQNNDEYKFAELDSLENESNDNPEYGLESPPPKSQGVRSNVNIKRNALIAVGIIVFVMLMYKFIGGMLSSKSPVLPPDETPIAEAPPITTPTPIEPQIASEPIQLQPIQTQTQENNSALQQKVASIEVTQQSVQSEVSSVSQQVGNVNTNVNTLSSQINKLNQTISELSNQVAKQSAEINVLMDRTKPKPVKRVVLPRQVNEQIFYYINAVIPGRAWLIGTNGSTLTVREGSNIAGYGVVKLIDSMQGRVLTSSGRVIKFSQEDS
jgi:intracellular multiplication protein IcmG